MKIEMKTNMWNSTIELREALEKSIWFIGAIGATNVLAGYFGITWIPLITGLMMIMSFWTGMQSKKKWEKEQKSIQ